jgi:hypothetical protein
MASKPSPSSTEPAELGVVVVSYNTRELLARCLASVSAEAARSGVRAEVWVVDNASRDGSAEMVRTAFPEVRLVEETANVGFAAANNVVLRRWLAPGGRPPRWLLLLNPDAELTPGSLARLITGLSSQPGAGLAGPSLRYPDGGFQHAAFRFPGLIQTWLDLFPVPRLMDHPLNGRYPRSRYDRAEPFAVDFPLGACLLAPGEAARQVGVLDEGFRLYCEELDWARRFQRAGLGVVCVPAAVVIHHAGASSRQLAGESFSRLWQSRLRYFDRYEPPLRRVVLRASIRAGLALRLLADRVAAARGRLPAQERDARRAAYRAVFAAPGR